MLDGYDYGIFIVPANLFSKCFTTFNIGHYRDNEGYKKNYYDKEDTIENK
jgi:hypothetical protein